MTAVEWLEKEFVKLEHTIGVHHKMYELLEQAKEMEKQQIVNAFNDGRKWNNSWQGETYYNELFDNPNTIGR